MIFAKGTIRVLTPKTTDGNSPMRDEKDRQVWREDFLPLSAKKEMERQNKSLPKHLQKKIEVVEQPVKNRVAPKVEQTEDVDFNQENDFEDEPEETQEPEENVIVQRKRGPKKRTENGTGA